MASSRAAGLHRATTALGLLVLLLACPTLQQLHASSSSLQLKRSQLSEDDILQTFFQWTFDYGRVYSSILEQQRRFDIFRDNLLYILGVNEQEGLTYELGLNNFTDLTHDEFQEHCLGLNPEPEHALSAPAAATECVNVDVEPEKSVDWRDEGAVTEVKNQGRCAVGAIEGVHKIKRGELLSLSPQAVLDYCTGGSDPICHQNVFKSYGCKSLNGTLDRAGADDYMRTLFEKRARRRRPQADALYQGRPNHALVSIIEYTPIGYNSQGTPEILRCISEEAGPVVVGIDAHNRDFQHYKRGIYNCGSCPFRGLNQAVVLASYGISHSPKYWKIKNSWGGQWDEKRYLLLEQGDV